MHKRVIATYSILMSFVMGIFFRVFYISQNNDLAMVSNNQSSCSLDVYTKRAPIYDCNLKLLVNTEDSYIASFIPSPDTLSAIMDYIPKEKKESILSQIKNNKPILVPVTDPRIYHDEIKIINIKKRYSDNQLAPHIIGYLDDHKNGICGIEKSFNNFLKSNSSQVKIKYPTDALHHSYDRSPPVIEDDSVYNNQGIVLTIDRNIQAIIEEAAISITKGAIVVMDTQDGEIKAIASIPKYNPNNISDFLNHPDSPMINRAFSEFSVGSLFKIIIAAAALEADYNKYIKFHSTCVGCKQVSNHIFNCHFKPGHGTINMKRALEISCNPYFIELALNTGPINALEICKGLNFGKADNIVANMKTASGYLTDKKDLTTSADISNFSFGQGKLTTTPIQIAKMISMIANDGYSVTPKLFKGISDKDGKYIQKEEKSFCQSRIISSQSASAVKNMLISVVDNGSGKNSKPTFGGAGGKTSSAQTGRYFKGNPEEEIVQAWFAGFFPIDTPKYVIVVLVEEGNSGSDIAAPVFKRIANKINNLLFP